jgi:hypothetical protein
MTQKPTLVVLLKKNRAKYGFYAAGHIARNMKILLFVNDALKKSS